MAPNEKVVSRILATMQTLTGRPPAEDGALEAALLRLSEAIFALEQRVEQRGGELHHIAAADPGAAAGETDECRQVAARRLEEAILRLRAALEG